MLGKLESADDAADSKPLAAAIHGFNASHYRLAGLDMPPLTEQEVIAAIRFQKTRRNKFDITDGEFARMQQIADTRRLPADAEISVLTGYQPGDGYRYDIWSVRFSMREQVNTVPYPFTGFTIREHYVQSQPLDLDKIAWGPVAENGLQAGVRFEPRQARYFAGQKVTPYFYYRNTGDRKFDISFPNLESGKLVAADNAGVAIPVDEDKSPKWIVGFMGFGEFGFGSQHEIRGRTIVLGDVERDDAEFAIRAKAGQAVRVHFVLSNYGDQGGSQLHTGEIAFSMAGTESRQSRTEKVPGTVDRSRQLTGRWLLKTCEEHGEQFTIEQLKNGDIPENTAESEEIIEGWKIFAVASFDDKTFSFGPEPQNIAGRFEYQIDFSEEPPTITFTMNAAPGTTGENAEPKSKPQQVTQRGRIKITPEELIIAIAGRGKDFPEDFDTQGRDVLVLRYVRDQEKEKASDSVDSRCGSR